MPHVATIAAVMAVATGHSILGTWLQKSLEASETASVHSGPMHADHASESAYHSQNSSRDDKQDDAEVVVPLLGPALAASSSNGASSTAVVGAGVGTDARQDASSGSVTRFMRFSGGGGPADEVRDTASMHACMYALGGVIGLAWVTFVRGVQVGIVDEQMSREEGVKAMWRRWHRGVRWAAAMTHHVGAAPSVSPSPMSLNTTHLNTTHLNTTHLNTTVLALSIEAAGPNATKREAESVLLLLSPEADCYQPATVREQTMRVQGQQTDAGVLQVCTWLLQSASH